MIDADLFLASGAIMSLSPDEIAVGWGRMTLHTARPDAAISFYFPDFFLRDTTPWMTFEFQKVISSNDLIKSLSAGTEKYPAQWSTKDQTLFLNECTSLKGLFQAQKLSKAVPYAFERSPERFRAPHLAHAIKNGLAQLNNRRNTLYGTWDETGGILGVTPEILFRGTENHIETVALAGTSSPELPPESLDKDPKTLQEHNWVVTGIEEVLRPFGTVTRAPQQVLKLGVLAHLMTPLSLECRTPPDFDSLVRALHPTPALGAYPKNAGASWLQKYDALLPRGRFGAPQGVSLEKENLCIVGIRNIQWSPSGAALGAGCGVVAASDPIAEWDEVKRKWKAIKNNLDL